MTMPRVSAPAVAAGTALDRAISGDELEAIWIEHRCDQYRGAAGSYLRGIYKAVCARIDSQARALNLARAI